MTHGARGKNLAKSRAARFRAAQKSLEGRDHATEETGGWTHTCRACGKRSFPSRATAKRAAKSIDRTMRAYQCLDCDDWHMGHLPPWVRAAIATETEASAANAAESKAAAEHGYRPGPTASQMRAMGLIQDH